MPTALEASARDAPGVEGILGRLGAVPRYVDAINRRLGRPFRREDVDDLSQDIAIRIWRKVGRAELAGTPATWIYRFCVLECMNRLRTHRRAPRFEPQPESLESPTGEGRPTPRLVELEQLLRELDELPPAEAEVVELRHFEELAFDEIGARLGIPGNTAKTRYHRALGRLRTRLSSAVPSEWR